MLMFSLSGIVLNHRTAVADLNVGREWLPGWYHYKAWNGGLMRGTLPYAGVDSVARVIVYGNGGIWLTDREASSLVDFNSGLPPGADFRQVRSVVRTADGTLFAVSVHGLYRYDAGSGDWHAVSLPGRGDELLTDAVCRGDTLVVAGRSYLYLSVAPYVSFKKVQLKAPEDYQAKVTLFRTVWMLHSGELFGVAGRLVVDAIAVMLILLCVTGMACLLFPRYVRMRRRKGEKASDAAWWPRVSFLWHEKAGRLTIVLTLFVAVTGWCLRPPVMLPLVMAKIPAVAGTTLDSPNPWRDKLRMIRYDEAAGDWLLSTSEGFYSLREPGATPVRISQAPPVSVMGLNVFQKDDSGSWLCGSFSGLSVWDRRRNTVVDYFTREPVADVAAPPFGKKAISGYSRDFACGGFPVEYYDGTMAVAQPSELDTLPMSLWNVALEVHSGRIYMGSAATYFFVFFAGIGAVWCLWSGWKLRRRSK